MERPNLKLSYHEQDGTLFRTFASPISQRMINLWGDMAAWRSLICVTITQRGMPF